MQSDRVKQLEERCAQLLKENEEKERLMASGKLEAQRAAADEKLREAAAKLEASHVPSAARAGGS